MASASTMTTLVVPQLAMHQLPKLLVSVDVTHIPNDWACSGTNHASLRMQLVLGYRLDGYLLLLISHLKQLRYMKQSTRLLSAYVAVTAINDSHMLLTTQAAKQATIMLQCKDHSLL